MFYPIAGFCITDSDESKLACLACSVYNIVSDLNYIYNFGYGFRAAIDCDLLTLLPILGNMTVSFEVQYQVMDEYNRV